MVHICSRILFCSFFTLILLTGCDPKPAIVGSPGAGNRWKIVIFSGDNQLCNQGDTLLNRLIVKLTDLADNPKENEDIRFYLISGSGQVQKPVLTKSLMELVTPTDFEGKATAQFFNFGGDSLGFSQIRAEVLDSAHLSVVFTVGTL